MDCGRWYADVQDYNGSGTLMLYCIKYYCFTIHYLKILDGEVLDQFFSVRIQEPLEHLSMVTNKMVATWPLVASQLVLNSADP